MIVADDAAFPNNVVNLLAVKLAQIDPDIELHKRPLRTTDGVQCIGVFPTDWIPTPNTHEMRGATLGGGLQGEMFPTLTEYTVSIQSLITDTEEERGIAVHAALATRIRATVARDAALQVALGQLASVVSGHQESFRRAEVRRQRYLTMELSGTWLYMSVTQFWFQTESR